MAKRNETRERGSGITRYRQNVTVFDLTQALTKDEAKELSNRITGAVRPLWDNERRVAEMREALADIEKRLPPDHDECDFRPHEDLGWYYARLIRLDGWVHRDIKKGDAAMAAYNAAEFGGLFAELQIKLVWERDALAGRKSHVGAREGARLRGSSEKIQDRRETFFSTYDEAMSRRLHPTLARQKAAKAACYNDDYARRLLAKR